ncbi:uncharacterized protein B0H18DRAFT_1085727 [Fomitopsis serialis]|uniref:uncharacterized protein n=1 Tax=Fomitopsis serialis TaxID=139415 RepID=UPI00200723EF|nr:uncharacterized protein B0H18DRAFT_1085727 [Neoantrodia serialis]KAH9923377.1 hypothetical protein B0H18DRAFT_1085727 [Neoantrodia serialis]
MSSRANRKRKDGRACHDRVHVRNHDWMSQRHKLIRAYLEYRTGKVPMESDELEQWDFIMVDFFTPADRINPTLLRHGYIGWAPLRPSVAVSLDVLEAYRQQHRVCPRFGLQAQVKALCHLHQVPFNRSLVEQMNVVFDVYLDILHGVDVLVNVALARDTPNWCMLNACAPCLYSLEEEEPLKPKILTCMDGNQSLKLVDEAFRAGTTRIDDRTARTDIWISPGQVDRFKDEAGSKAPASSLAEADDIELPDDNEALGSSVAVCIERWRNAGPEAHKKMFSLFAITGIFACICRHGQLLTCCDMIRSGELMKYPLAIVNKLIEVYGEDIAVGYDIACAFWKTLERSCLAERARSAHLRGVVCAFHGYSHNCWCQLHWHPMYLEGVGKEDFEGCERLFSESNALAGNTRLATAFHRAQAIKQHFAFWGEQKHTESGKFLYNNYKQALKIISNETKVFEVLGRQLGTTPADYEKYLVEERAYLEGLKSEPPEVARRLDYIEALMMLADTGYQCTDADVNKILTLYRTRYERYEVLDQGVCLLEEELSIVQCWLPQSPEWTAACVVVQRLFELTKLRMSGIGYKMREKIGKALKARAEAIRKALSEYNRVAARLTPPPPSLTWHELMEMATLSEFDLLRDTRQDIRRLPWAQHTNRKAMAAYFNIKCAREEIHRCNIESARLFTNMVDEHVDFVRAIEKTRPVDPDLSQELSRRHAYRDCINSKIVAKLYDMSKLPGFSGKLYYGKHVGRDPANLEDIPLPSWVKYTAPDTGSAADDEDDDGNGDVDESPIPGVEGSEMADALVGYMDELGRSVSS